MGELHRHQIARLGAKGWQRLLAVDWDAEARDCLSHWAGQGLPLVVTRQHRDDDGIAVGLCAPQRWRHRRISLRVARHEILSFDEFPRLEQLVAHLSPGARQLVVALQACNATARVFGSHGWQHLTGLQHVREGSDLDLWIGVNSIAQADAVAAALDAFASPAPRLDGELVFDDGAAVAWREWLAWRSGRARALLVKRLHGASMEVPA